MRILTLNAGSSSLKWAVFDDLDRERGGTIENVTDYTTALRVVLDQISDIDAAGHRVVHGGIKFDAPVVITADVLADLETLIPLAPLHQPYNLAGIQALVKLMPGLPQVACFDTAFHRTQPRLHQLYALPKHYIDMGIMRYGFHGLSYEYICTVLPKYLDTTAYGRVVIAHLGSGASMCAVQNLKSVASSMGFSALDGLPMGTRCGALDPGVILYLLESEKLSVKGLTQLLYKQSGLLGLSGISNDMRALLASDDPLAHEAVAYFVHRIICEAGSLIAVLGGLDAFVFTGGIGERAKPIRDAVIQGLSWLGQIPYLVIPTNEELTIAKHIINFIS